ncbi:MAG: alpha/beta hydrolase [Mycobacteriales bacterium]
MHVQDAGPASGTPAAVGAAAAGKRPRPSGSSLPDRALDLLAVVIVVPVLITVWQSVLAAWRVYHPPVRPTRQRPETVGLAAERVMVPGAGGLPLACWFIPAAGPADVVVIGHGIRRDSGSVMGLARRLHDAGYHVLTFDMRNHGDSAQDHLPRGQSALTGIDFHRMVRYVAGRPEAAGRKVALIGFSMSAWTAMWAARREPELVRAVVCDSGPAMDLVGTIRRTYDVARSRMPRLLRGPLMFRIGRFAFTRASVFFFQPAEWPQLLPDPTVPVLFVCGERDPIVRPADSREQLAHYPSASLWVVPRAYHTQSVMMEPEEYVRRVTELLDRAGFMPAAPPARESVEPG